MKTAAQFAEAIREAKNIAEIEALVSARDEEFRRQVAAERAEAARLVSKCHDTMRLRNGT